MNGRFHLFAGSELIWDGVYRIPSCLPNDSKCRRSTDLDFLDSRRFGSNPLLTDIVIPANVRDRVR